MRKTQNNNIYPYTIIGIGDSQTDLLANYGVVCDEMWTSLLSKIYRTKGINTKSRVFGQSGYTTNQIIGFADCMFMYDIPKISVIYCGVNDPGSSVSTSTAQGGTTNTITLQSNSSTRNNSYVGQIIRVGSDIKTIIAYNNTTFIATVDSNFTSIPTSSTTYTIDAPTQFQTQQNLQALAKIAKYGVKGLFAGTGQSVTVWNTSQLPSKSQIGSRLVVMQDNSTTGGCKNYQFSTNATIIGDYSASIKQSVWECRNSQAGELGWSRVAINSTPSFSDGCQNVVIVTPNYQNWSTGGDNYNTITSTGTQYTSYVPIRQAAKDAANAESVLLCDLYDYQSKLIYASNNGTTLFNGTIIYPETTQGSFTWHYIDGNQHHNEYGHYTVANAVFLILKNITL